MTSGAPPPPLFAGRRFCLCNSLVGNQQLKATIKQHHGALSSAIGAATDFLLGTEADAAHRGYKVVLALRYGVPLVSVGFVYSCIGAERVLEHQPFVLLERDEREAAWRASLLSRSRRGKNEPSLSRSMPQSSYEHTEIADEENEHSLTGQGHLDGSGEEEEHDERASEMLLVSWSPSSTGGSGVAECEPPRSPPPSAEQAAPPSASVLSRHDHPKRQRHWGLTRIYTLGAANEPPFPSSYQVLRSHVFNYCDLHSNENKFYAIQVHQATGDTPCPKPFRVFTHYGRVGDTEQQARRECRYLDTLQQAQMIYDLIFEDKSSEQKGYQSVALAAPSVGSADTTNATTDSQALTPSPSASISSSSSSSSSSSVLALVDMLYAEATNALTKTIAGKITERGIETPLGVLTAEQIERGEKILDDLEAELTRRRTQTTSSTSSTTSSIESAITSAITTLSGRFYSVIPHVLDPDASPAHAIIDSAFKIEEKRETLQRMRDMQLLLQSSGERSFSPQELRYRALGVSIERVADNDPLRRTVLALLGLEGTFEADEQRQATAQLGLELHAIYRLQRESEAARFSSCPVYNSRLLLHGSRVDNLLGLLSRGFMLPRKLTELGGRRTDVGLMGAGIYFGDCITTAARYTSTPTGTGAGAAVSEASRSFANHRFALVCTVALGRSKHLFTQDPTLTSAPLNYHSCIGVKSTPLLPTDFRDCEYVVYNTSQIRLEYLVEFECASTSAVVPPAFPSVSSITSTSTSTSTTRQESSATRSPTAAQQRAAIIDSIGGAETGWHEALAGEFDKPYFARLVEFVARERASTTVFPPEHLTCRALALTPLAEVRAVILGQDPYVHAGQASGLAFSVSSTGALPPSVRNIFCELRKDLGISCTSGDLSAWARQGVLLLNTCLTVRISSPGSHRSAGWEHFTDAIISAVNERCSGVVFMLWGKPAHAKQTLIDGTRHRLLLAAHPSPLSAAQGFFGCRHFSLANEYLASVGKRPIDWRLSEEVRETPAATPAVVPVLVREPPVATLGKRKEPETVVDQTRAAKAPTLERHQVDAGSRSVSRFVNYSPITSLRPYAPSERRAVLVRVYFCSPRIWWTSSETGSEVEMMYADVVDAHGSRIRAVAFGSARSLLAGVQEDGVCGIANFVVQPASKTCYQYTDIRGQQYQLALRDSSLVTALDASNAAAVATLPHIVPKFLNTSAALASAPGSVVDLVASVLHVGPLREITSRRNNAIPLRTVTCYPAVKLSLWYDEATNCSLLAGDDIAVTGVQVTEFQGTKSFSTKHCSYHLYSRLQHNNATKPIPAHVLRELRWYASSSRIISFG